MYIKEVHRIANVVTMVLRQTFVNQQGIHQVIECGCRDDYPIWKRNSLAIRTAAIGNHLHQDHCS